MINREPLLEKFKVTLGVQKVSVNTLGAYFRYVNKFLDVLDDLGKEFDEISLNEVSIFLSRLNQDNSTASSSLLARAALKRFFDLHEVTLRWSSLKLPRVHRPVEPLINEKELLRLISFLKPLEEAFVLLSVASGARFSECVSVRFEDIDWAEGVMYIRKHKDSLPLKTGEGECILLGDYFSRLKKTWVFEKRDDKGLIFLRFKGKAKKRVKGVKKVLLTNNRLWKELQKAKRDSGVLKPIHPHTFRALYITNSYDRTHKDLIATRDVARHKNVNTTQIYVRNRGKNLTDFKSLERDREKNFGG